MYPQPDFERKIISPNQLTDFIQQLPRPLVFTNGCFDIIHRGHVSYLAQARALGASLILALNTDASVKRQGKGNDRPINSLENRAAVCAALQSIDLVTWFDEDTPFNLIEFIQPDILVKGGDWQPENIVGAKETLARGGQVHSNLFHANLELPIYQESFSKLSNNWYISRLFYLYRSFRFDGGMLCDFFAAIVTCGTQNHHAAYHRHQCSD